MIRPYFWKDRVTQFCLEDYFTINRGEIKEIIHI